MGSIATISHALRGCAAGAFALALMAPAVHAQEVAGEILGRVEGRDGAPLAGAQVTITHLPSGTVARLRTGARGEFAAYNLRIGGPYRVEALDAAGQTVVLEALAVELGAQTRASLSFAPAAEVDDVVVVGDRSGQVRSGIASEFDAGRIRTAPTVDRDFRSVIRQDPLVRLDPTRNNAISIAGANSRFNSITVDGLAQQDTFGLNISGFATQRPPIALDAIAALSVQVAPYDVEYGNFTGGNINIVTRSGTNRFAGSAYGFFSDDSLRGDRINGRPVDGGAFEEYSYGATFGGPLIRDKLFFFGAYERLDSEFRFLAGPTDGGTPTPFPGITRADVARIQQIARDVYGFEAGGYDDPVTESDEKILAKLDWNINDRHRLSGVFQRSSGSFPESFQTETGLLALSSNFYDTQRTLTTGNLHLFSDWTDGLSTELQIGYQDISNDVRTGANPDLAHFEVTTPGGGVVTLGAEEFRVANDIDTESLQIKAKVKYATGDHRITAGYERLSDHIDNLFIPFQQGSYTTTIDLFAQRRASFYLYGDAVSGNPNDARAIATFNQNVLYVQDAWDITPRLSLTTGLRYERYDVSDRPRLNANFVNRHGFSNTATLDGRDVWLPRVGLVYRPDDRTTVRAGAGLFAGGTPNVWYTNPFGADGISTNTLTPQFVLGASVLQTIDAFNTLPTVRALLAPGDGNTDALDPEFELPSTLKFSIGAERSLNLGPLGDDYLASVDLLFTDVRQGVLFQALRARSTRNAYDGRPIYTGGSQDILLTNTQDGGGVTALFRLSKAFDTGVDLDLGYAYVDVDEVTPATSSSTGQLYQNIATSDPNDPSAAPSNYAIKHRVTVSASYERELIAGLKSTVGLFVEARSGQLFSYAFRDGTNPFGDPRPFNRQLFYVPSGPGDVILNGIDQAAFDSFLQETGLDRYRGGIAPRNAFESNWVTTADLHLAQEVPLPSRAVRGSFVVDVRNLTNLINSDWGVIEQPSFPYIVPVANVAIDGATGRYIYSNLNTASPQLVVGTPSLWRIQVGFRIDF